ncbi:hypothetical protein TTHERM_000497439 (macronuclear) [Tetrahymena thermophila SB210]|uniref:Uncharacterized protein n=1 Tax=Tetrahymena thermophila (strain SB210) TaxID=312017 RepID=W7XDS9_TETTS|nr:hypothetical protein TTHERM_000497439 [Tetrahymena thermophila SB210]EWS70949.1 hypothetical protein TTHERM_000497439 [Tetrahymena thermophila SB210]|eukprot:XP_012656505.1 hypothetical protein TTHERM_000497439 [Tetrahymena thermophila SB210]
MELGFYMLPIVLYFQASQDLCFHFMKTSIHQKREQKKDQQKKKPMKSQFFLKTNSITILLKIQVPYENIYMINVVHYVQKIYVLQMFLYPNLYSLIFDIIKLFYKFEILTKIQKQNKQVEQQLNKYKQKNQRNFKKYQLK